MPGCEYDSKRRALTGGVLLLFMGVVAIANAVTPDKTFSQLENRVLEPFPRLSLHSLMSGRFTSDYATYTSDQFPLRDLWVRAKTFADRALGKQDSNGVFLGTDGYLIERYTSPSDEVMEDRVRAIAAFDDATPGLHTYVMLVPTAASVLSDKLPAYAPVGDQWADLQRIRASLPRDVHFVDVFPALHAERSRPIFYKTDHHWTTEGAYYAYAELARQMGLKPQAQASFHIRNVTDEFYGSLYSKSGFHHVQPDGIDVYRPKTGRRLEVEYVDEGTMTGCLYETKHLDRKDKYAMFLDGNHPLIRITTEGPVDRKLLVVKDSYANSLIPFFTEHFGQIHIVDLRYYDKSLLELVQKHEIQDMLILYNIKTFFDDPSILHITEGIQ